MNVEAIAVFVAKMCRGTNVEHSLGENADAVS
jgi:hypothetical protein